MKNDKRELTPEAVEYLKREVNLLSDFEYRDLCAMLSNTFGVIDLKQVQSMVYTARNMDEAEAMMFQ